MSKLSLQAKIILVVMLIPLAWLAAYLILGPAAMKMALAWLAANTPFAEVAVHVVFLIVVLIWGWFSALRVGNAVSFPIKIGVLAATAGVYVLSSNVWVPMVVSAARRLAS